jgi:hypothetical protein
MNNLRCDFHIHTTYSDGECSVEEILKLYAREKFDVIAITDHALDQTSLKLFNQYGWIPRLCEQSFSAYLEYLQEAGEKARMDYNLHLIPGVEVSNNTKEYHILALDIKEWIDPDLPVPAVVAEIHRQGGVAVACHPEEKTGIASQGAYRHLYENRERYRALFDAWEVANRHHLFPSVGLMKVPYLANSDLHRPEDIFSWKTLLKAEKFNTDSIKEAICTNETISIFLHRNELF